MRRRNNDQLPEIVPQPAKEEPGKITVALKRVRAFARTYSPILTFIVLLSLLLLFGWFCVHVISNHGNGPISKLLNKRRPVNQ